jgi:hypothetical protein
VLLGDVADVQRGELGEPPPPASRSPPPPPRSATTSSSATTATCELVQLGDAPSDVPRPRGGYPGGHAFGEVTATAAAIGDQYHRGELGTAASRTTAATTRSSATTRSATAAAELQVRGHRAHAGHRDHHRGGLGTAASSTTTTATELQVRHRREQGPRRVVAQAWPGPRRLVAQAWPGRRAEFR